MSALVTFLQIRPRPPAEVCIIPAQVNYRLLVQSSFGLMLLLSILLPITLMLI